MLQIHTDGRKMRILMSYTSKYQSEYICTDHKQKNGSFKEGKRGIEEQGTLASLSSSLTQLDVLGALIFWIQGLEMTWETI